MISVSELAAYAARGGRPRGGLARLIDAARSRKARAAGRHGHAAAGRWSESERRNALLAAAVVATVVFLAALALFG